MKKTIFSLVVLLFLISIAIILVSNKNRTSVEQLALDADTKPSQKIPVSVSDKFFSVTVPSKKKTTCIWTYAEGNGGIPYSEKTETEGAVNIHTVANKQITESAYDYGVECSDETGIKFFGEFPGDMQKKFEADSQKKSQNEELNKLNSYISDNDLSYLNTLSGKYTSDIDFFENKVLNNRLSKLLGQSSFSILKNY